jgi:L-fuconolactonase
MVSFSSEPGKVDRRDILKTGALLVGALATGEAIALPPPPLPVIDTHIHLFDPTRPNGVPWPEPSDTVLYKPALPNRYKQISQGFGVVGAIAIEASPLAKDNDWLLQVARQNPLIVGIIGDLVPSSPEFATQLERLHKDPLFKGLRYGNLWNRNLAEDRNRPCFMEGLKLLAEAGLVFESANPNPALMHALADIAQSFPDLTIVIDHLPQATPPANAAEKSALANSLNTLSKASKVFVKLSEIPLELNGSISTESDSYKDTLDELWSRFGEDKVLFGSDWPNSDHLLPYAETVSLLKNYAAGKSRIAQEKLFWRNSIHAYRWHPRLPSQPS